MKKEDYLRKKGEWKSREGERGRGRKKGRRERGREGRMKGKQ